MKKNLKFELIAVTPAGLADPAIAIAASRAGAIGVLDLQYTQDEQIAINALEKLARYARRPCGVKLDGKSDRFVRTVTPNLPEKIDYAILTPGTPETLSRLVQALNERRVLCYLETTCLEQVRSAEELGLHGVIAKGSEAGGQVGEETTLILLQQILANTALPVWAHGGIGLHTVGACFTAGAAGAVLDAQLYLTRESAISDSVKTVIARMDGSETICLGEEMGGNYRIFARPDLPVAQEIREALTKITQRSQARAEKQKAWRREIQTRIGWENPERNILLLGQDAAFAKFLAERYHTVGGVLDGLRQAIESHIHAAQSLQPLAENSPLAQSHQTQYPIVQGPMTRVSDTAAFAEKVAAGGGLPMLALAMMRAPEVETLLNETGKLLGKLSWGVGILGFVPLDLRQEQLEVIHEYKPPFAIIAGGRPDQAAALEKNGTAAYLHVPSPGLLEMFLKNGARRFIFEGRECGGHVGPRSSFVLWNTMVEILLQALSNKEMKDCHILFAGGIHDALSSSMIATIAAPLAKGGAKIGALLGTAYLFTKEATTTGAIGKAYQKQALQCSKTVLLETGPGHATRCAESPYARTFNKKKGELSKKTLPGEDLRNQLEKLNLGRLRVASKGLQRNASHATDPNKQKLIKVTEKQQHSQGMYMIGQVAALRDRTCTIKDLHVEVSVKGSKRLAEIAALKTSRFSIKRKEQPSDIAIIGMECFLPGAGNMQAYWENILNKVDAITEVPKERWDWQLYFDPDPKARDKIYSKWGGFMDPIPFDPMNYGMPPNTLPSIEPMQLLTLEVVRKALADAGYADRPFARDRTSVIIGVGGGAGDLGQQYALRSGLPMFVDNPAPEVWDRLPEWTEDSFAGILSNVVAGRVANRFNFGGVNYTVDAACASSLAAVYLASRELENGTSDMVLVGGADTVQNPFGYLCFSKTHALSPRGRCRTFDESADGIVISEGFAMLVLKRLADAERDGDRIYGVIKAVAGSSDGRDKGLTAPRPEGQARSLERAYAKANFSPATVELIEAHGTGTVVGDKAEVETLRRVFESAGASGQGCAIGSVKSMIGHTKCAAGVAGLMKITRALYHKVLPPTMHVEKPNSVLSESSFYVNTEARPWIHGASDQPRRAGVSAFGFGGTNFHAVVEEYKGDFLTSNRKATTQNWPCELLLWSAPSRTALLAEIAALETQLAQGTKPTLRDLAYTLWQNTQRQRLSLTLAIVATSIDDLREKMLRAKEALKSGKQQIQDPRGIYFFEQPLAKEGKIAFLFPGQGSQYLDMLAEMAIHFHEVREAFESADRVLDKPLSGRLSAYVYPPPRFGPEEEQDRKKALTQTNIAQAALGAAEVGLHHLLQTFGIRADMTAGHSYGEYVALWAAGVFDEETLFRLSEARGRCILDSAKDKDLGTMAAVQANTKVVADVINTIDEVWVANHNAPNQTIISGAKRGIENAIKALVDQGISASRIDVSCAFHSAIIAPARDRLAKLLATVKFDKPGLPVFSNTLSAPHSANPKEIATVLSEHLVQPVEFVNEIRAMYDQGARIFVEVGPRNILTNLTQKILENRPALSVALDAPGRSPLIQLQHALGLLGAHGVPLQLDRLYDGREVRALDLKNLVEETAPQQLSPTTWMVDCGRSRPLKEAAKPDKRAEGAPQKNNAPASALLDVAKPEAGPEAAPEIPLPSQSADEASQIFLRHQQLMNRFLETQQQVMLAYLNGSQSSVAVPSDSPAEKPEASTSGLTPTEHERSSISKTEVPQPSTSDESGPDLEERPPVDITRQLLQIVSERTGYPAEILDLDMDMEADLSIDSIKRVEILGALQQGCFPDDQGDSQEAMEELIPIKTLRGIVEWFSAAQATQAENNKITGEGPAHPDVEEITKQLLQIVGERTGYPTEILDLNMDMEAELSIDSIKRVEILGALQQVCFPGDQSYPQDAMEKLTKIKTLQGIIDWFSEAATRPTAIQNELLVENLADPDNDMASDQRNGQGETLPRFLLKAVETPKETKPLQVTPGSLFVITDDQQGVAAGIGDELQSLGAHVALVRMGERVAQINRGFYEADLTDESAVAQLLKLIRKQNQAPVAGIIHLLPLRKHKPFVNIDFKTWQRTLSLGVKSLFYLVKAAHEDLTRTAVGGQSWIIAATESVFENTQSETFFPGHGAIAGLVKTMALEWPGIHCQAIDFESQTRVPDLTTCIFTEMAVGDREVEVGYNDGKRQILRSVLTPLSSARPSNLIIDSSSVILITGGGRGITAEIAGELARQYQPTLLLVGKSAFPETEEPAEIANLNSPQELKAAILEQKRQKGEAPTARDLETAYNQLLRERELRNTLATLQQAGARVQYFQTDVCDERAFGALIDKIYSTYDKIDGFIHGAGILEDKLIVDKTSDSFDRVLNTKAHSGFILSKKLRPDSLKFLVFFTSIAGRFGNRGQCDYAAGNEVLNKLALYLDQQWPGRVVALNWGPWAKTGMVSPGVRKQFADRGVQLISPEAGRRALLDELKFGQKGQVEIIVGDGPWEKIAAEPMADFPDALALLDGTKLKGDGGAQELEFTLDSKNDPYLLDHQLDGKPVFPTAMAMELMAETVRRAWPDWEIVGIQSLQVLHGIIIEKDAEKIRVVARPQSNLTQESPVHDVLVEIFADDQSKRAAFRGLVQLAKRFPESPVLKNDKLATLRPFSLSVPEAYRQWLFHGRCFQGISQIDGVNEHGLSAVIKPSSPSDCLQNAAANQWLLDPIVIDCGFQLAILWQREQHGMTPLPARFKTFRRFGSTGNGPLRCYLHARTEAEGHILLVDLYFANQQGRVVSLVEQMEFSCSNTLNRLAEAATAGDRG